MAHCSKTSIEPYGGLKPQENPIQVWQTSEIHAENLPTTQRKSFARRRRYHPKWAWWLNKNWLLLLILSPHLLRRYPGLSSGSWIPSLQRTSFKAHSVAEAMPLKSKTSKCRQCKYQSAKCRCRLVSQAVKYSSRSRSKARVWYRLSLTLPLLSDGCLLETGSASSCS